MGTDEREGVSKLAGSTGGGMNNYASHCLKRFFEAYQYRLFDQDDVALLVLMTRDYTPKGGVFRELGDFLAHPDAKDRGLVLSRIEAFAEKIEVNPDRAFRADHGDPAWPSFEGLGGLAEISRSLSSLFKLIELDIQVDEESPEFRDFVFCLVFMLSACQLKLGAKLHEMKVDYAHGLTLQFRYQCVTDPRYTAILPVLRLHSVWPQHFGFHREGKVLSGHVARRLADGVLAAIPYEMDKVGGTFGGSLYKDVWPNAVLRRIPRW